MMVMRRWRILSTKVRPRDRLVSQFIGSYLMVNAKHKSADVKLCPTCGAPTIDEVRPFCSRRCADVDLGRWLQGVYAIPAVDAADDSIIDAALAVSGKFNKADPGDEYG